MISTSDWLNLEKALHRRQSLVESIQNFSCLQIENTKDENKPIVSIYIYIYSSVAICFYPVFAWWNNSHRKDVKVDQPVYFHWRGEPEANWGGKFSQVVKAGLLWCNNFPSFDVSSPTRSVLFTWIKPAGCWICCCLLCPTTVRTRTENRNTVSPQTLDEDAKILTEKLDYFSRYITR